MAVVASQEWMLEAVQLGVTPGIVVRVEIDWSGTSVTAKAWFRTNLNNGYYHYWFKCNNVTIKYRTSGTIGKNWYGGNQVASATSSAASHTFGFSWASQNGQTWYTELTAYNPYQLSGQTFRTEINNYTGGFSIGQVDRAVNTAINYIETNNKSYVGDSVRFWWDKNNEGNFGINCRPASFACCDKLTSPGALSGWGQHAAWDYQENTNDLYHEWRTPLLTDWFGSDVVCLIIKYWTDSAGNRQAVRQQEGLRIQAKPTQNVNASLRSVRFYTGTPSCFVARLNSYSNTTYGYGVSNEPSNDNSAGRITDNTVPYKICVAGSIAGGTGVSIRVPSNNAKFNADYSIGSVLDMHTYKMSPTNPNGSAGVYTNIFNPRTGVADRLTYISNDMGTINRVSGTITLAKVTKIEPISGNGTTTILANKKKLYTNQSNVNITWKMTNSGNTNGFGYDIRETANSGTYASGNFHGNTLVDIQADGWKIDQEAATTTITHNNITNTGVNRSVSIVPYIKDSANYKIFGDQSGSLVTSDTWLMILIKVPSGITFDKWSNTLPAIDGVKDFIKYECTSPSDWGNVTDFSYGYKMRYRIGADTTRADGYQWLFLGTPTTTSTKFSGQFEQIYDRSLNTNCTAQICATNNYSTTWDAYLAYQSAYTTEKSFAIAAKDPYSKTTCSIGTTYTTTLDTEVTFNITCPSEDINGNTLVQTTTLKIDNGNAITLDNPVYHTTTPNTLTGNLTLSFDKLTQLTPTLSRGAHTLYVENEVVTYFDSISPKNHVYFGTTTLKSNVLNIEVAELPKAPTIKAPNPLTFDAGQARNLRFEFTPNDWGCLDTTYNYRRYEYELYDPNNEILASGYLAKTSTSYTHTITLISPDNDGVYTFKLREVTIVGVSPWSSRNITINKAIEPACSVLDQDDVLALPAWDWSFTWTPGNNGSYKSR